MKNAVKLEVLQEIVELVLEDHKTVNGYLKAVLTKANDTMIDADWGFVAVVERMTGAELLMVWDPWQDIVGRQAVSEWQKYAGVLEVGGENLPSGRRSFVGYVAHTRQPRNSGDVRQEHFYRNSNEQTRSELAVPVIFGSDLLAVINVESAVENYFTEEHERFLTLLARLLAAPLHGLMIGQGIRRPSLETHVLEKLGAVLSNAPVGPYWERSAVFDKAAAIIADALNSGLCCIWLVDDASGKLQKRGLYQKALNGLLLQESLADKAVEQKRLVKCGFNHENGNIHTLSALEELEPCPQMAIPLAVFGSAVGAIGVGFRHITPETPWPYYTQADEQLLEVLQGQLAAFVALKRRETGRIEQSARRAQQLSKVLEKLTELDLPSVLQEAVKLVPELCKTRHCSVFLWNETTAQFVLAASQGLSPKLIGEASYNSGEGLTGWVGKHGRPLILDSRSPSDLSKIAPDLEWKSKFDEAGFAEEQALQPFAAVPIFKAGRIYGVLRVSGRSEVFTEADELMMTLVATKISTAIVYSARYEERIRLLRGLQELMAYARNLPREQAGLAGIARDVLANACAHAAQVFGADIVTMYGVSKGEIETPPVWIGSLEHPGLMQSPLRAGDVPFQILDSQIPKYWRNANEAVPAESARKSENDRPRFSEREGVVSSAGIPLRASNNTVGVMFLNYKSVQEFDAERRESIEAFASQVALSLELGQLYDQIRESASREEALQLYHKLHGTKNTLRFGIETPAQLALHQLKNKTLRSLKSTLRSIEKQSQECLKEIKEVLGELQRDVIETAAIDERLRRYIRAVTPKKLQVKLSIQQESPLAPPVEDHLYLVVKESFDNVLKHSKASAVRIFLEIGQNRVLLEVEDNGTGFDPNIELRKGKSMGLSAMRKSVQTLKGTIAIDSQPGKGSVIRVNFPIDSFFRRPTYAGGAN